MPRLISRSTYEYTTALLRKALGIGYVMPGGTCPEDVLDICLDGGVSALTCAAAEGCVPEGMMAKWRRSVDESRWCAERRKYVEGRLMDLYGPNGVEMLILKGSSIARLYPEPGLRECGDIDICLFGGYDRGISLLEAHGIEVDREEEPRHACFQVDGFRVENHHPDSVAVFSMPDELLGDLPRGFIRGLADGSKAGLELQDGGYWFPDKEMLAVQTLSHIHHHFLQDRELRLRSVVDWYLCLKNLGAPSETVREYVREMGLTRFFNLFTAAVATILGVDLSDFTWAPEKKRDVKILVRKVIVIPWDSRTIPHRMNRIKVFWWGWKFVSCSRFERRWRITDFMVRRHRLRPIAGFFVGIWKKLANFARKIGTKP